MGISSEVDEQVGQSFGRLEMRVVSMPGSAPFGAGAATVSLFSDVRR
jgi:hypothetical protein